MKIIEKQVDVIDYNGIEQIAEIKFNIGVFLAINTYDKNNNHTGYMRMYFHPNNRLYLDVIYCYNEFRGSGIASFISELTDYILRDYQGYVIRGCYEPSQLSTDRENKIDYNNQELDVYVRKFYNKAGYEIIKYEEYLNNQEKYPYLTINDFFLDEGGYNVVVAKIIKLKDYSFYEEDGMIYYKKYINKKNICKYRNK